MDAGDTPKSFLEAFRYIPWYALFKYFKIRYYMSKIGNLYNVTQNGFLFHRGPCYGCGGCTKVFPRSIQVHTKVNNKFDPII